MSTTNRVTGNGGISSSLETGKVDIDDLAPRLKELRAEQRALVGKRGKLASEMAQAPYPPLDGVSMNDYVSDLKKLLLSPSFSERKVFLGSFISKVEFDKTQVGIEYTMPLPLGGGEDSRREVLSTGQPSLPG